MGSRRSNPNTDQYFPISKQTVGGVAGAIVGSAIAGTVGAVVGGVAGTLMGNRAARGESLVSTRALNSVKDAVTMLRKVNSVIPKWSLSKAKPIQGSSSAKAILVKESQGAPKGRSNARGSRKTGRQ